MKIPKPKVERKTVFYLLIAAGIFYNLFLGFSKKERQEQDKPTNKEISLSPDLK